MFTRSKPITSLEEQVLFSSKPPDWMIRAVRILRSVKVFENAIVIFVKSCSSQGHGHEAATYFVLDSFTFQSFFLLLVVGVDIMVYCWFWLCLKVAAGALWDLASATLSSISESASLTETVRTCRLGLAVRIRIYLKSSMRIFIYIWIYEMYLKLNMCMIRMFPNQPYRNGQLYCRHKQMSNRK